MLNVGSLPFSDVFDKKIVQKPLELLSRCCLPQQLSLFLSYIIQV